MLGRNGCFPETDIEGIRFRIICDLHGILVQK
jgi:hypothetical protein